MINIYVPTHSFYDLLEAAVDQEDHDTYVRRANCCHACAWVCMHVDYMLCFLCLPGGFASTFYSGLVPMVCVICTRFQVMTCRVGMIYTAVLLYTRIHIRYDADPRK